MSEPLGSPNRKRLRINESGNPPEVTVNKREKARERQRKKRERDRVVGPGGTIPIMHSDALGDGTLLDPEESGDHGLIPNIVTPEEMSKKERIRQAARERQRKHRAVVKARRMAELGIQMIPPNPHVPLGYRMNENGQMEPVHDANAMAQEGPAGSSGYGQTPGQTFAHLLMTSASLNHNLKQHLLRTLQMSTEELASFEPIIAAAWDHWNHQRMHYHQAATHRGPNDGHFGSGSSHEDVANGSDIQTDYGARFQHMPEATIVEGVSLQGGNPIDPSLAVRETSALRNQSVDEHEEGHPDERNSG